jgi:hypothetical protein
MLSHCYFEAYTKFNRPIEKGNIATFHLLYISPFALRGFSCLLKHNWILSNHLARSAMLLACIREVLSSHFLRKTDYLHQYDETNTRKYCIIVMQRHIVREKIFII